MNYKDAISTPTAQPARAVETPFLTIDEAYEEIQSTFLKTKAVTAVSPPVPQFMDASDHVVNIYNQLTSYWQTKNYLSKATVPSFCDMLRDVFHVEYIPGSEDEESTTTI